MDSNTIYIERFTAWAPNVRNQEEWMEWALGKRVILLSRDAPELGFTDPLFRRRLSQISRMTIQVIHDMLPFDGSVKIVFVSFRGEITQQLKINRMLIEQHNILPAAFSLSVFNAPAALATIALNLTGGYSAVYPGEIHFLNGLLSAAAPVLAGREPEILFVYADELIPPEYGELVRDEDAGHIHAQHLHAPLAFAVLFSGRETGGSIPLTLSGSGSAPDGTFCSPQDFIRRLFLSKS